MVSENEGLNKILFVLVNSEIKLAVFKLTRLWQTLIANFQFYQTQVIETLLTNWFQNQNKTKINCRKLRPILRKINEMNEPTKVNLIIFSLILINRY